MYLQLDSDRIVATGERLRDRIGERFSAASLTSVANELVDVARRHRSRSRAIRRPGQGPHLVGLLGLDIAMRQGPDTKSPPKRTLEGFELTRCLDYCSEMLSLLGKVAALYVQDFPDEVALQAVDDIENLTTSLSRKIWQKIVILDRPLAPRAGARSLTGPDTGATGQQPA